MAVVVTIVFLLIPSDPGDPVGVMLGPDATEAQIQATRRAMGLDRPIHEQLFNSSPVSFAEIWGSPISWIVR